MPQVPIPWFTGYEAGQNLYAGKAERQWRTLRGLSTGMYDLGALLRSRRNQGLPPGTTDEDLEQQEQKLELQLGTQQEQARDDTTHGVERASTLGDQEGARAIQRDPAEYAATKHEETQGFFPKLGDFMTTGLKRLMFGDPQRGQRLSHIHAMEGQLQQEKDRENFLKTAGATCMKSEDPDRCLQEMGGGRFGIRHLPKMQQRPTATQAGTQNVENQGIVPPPDKSMGGSAADRRDWDLASDAVRRRHGGSMPTDPNAARVEVDQEVDRLRTARKKATDDAGEARRKREFDYKRFAMAADAEQRDARKAAEKAKQQGGTNVSESFSYWQDANGKVWQFDDTAAARLMTQYPNFGLHKVKRTERHTEPATPAARQQQPPGTTGAPSGAPEEPDPGDEWGVKFFAPIRDERGGRQ